MIINLKKVIWLMMISW